MRYGVSLYCGSDPGRRYSIFRENFAMPLTHIHQLKGEEYAWMSYRAWLSFTHDGALNLAHPEDYRDVPYTTSMLRYHDPFVSQDEFLRERQPKESFRLSGQYLEKLRELLPRLQCKQGAQISGSHPMERDAPMLACWYMIRKIARCFLK